MGIVISIGKWGGLWISFSGTGKRVSLGWVAITFYPFDGDVLISATAKWQKVENKAAYSGLVIVEKTADGYAIFEGDLVSDTRKDAGTSKKQLVNSKTTNFS